MYDLDLRRLEQFVAVAQDQSYGRAARRLGIAQPNVSRAIAGLESEVGAMLFNRSPRGVTLTEAGSRLLPRAISILNEAEAALAEIGEPGTANRSVRLGCSAGLVDQRLPRLVTSPALAHISIDIFTGTRETLAGQLIAHEIDAAYCLIPELIHGGGRDLVDLHFERTGYETLAAFAAEAHPVHRDARGLGDLAQYRWAVPLQMSVTYRFESLFFRAGVAVPTRGLASASLALLAAAARDGAMIAILPVDYAKPGLVRIALEALSLPYLVGLLTRREPGMLPPVMAVLEALRQI